MKLSLPHEKLIKSSFPSFPCVLFFFPEQFISSAMLSFQNPPVSISPFYLHLLLLSLSISLTPPPPILRSLISTLPSYYLHLILLCLYIHVSNASCFVQPTNRQEMREVKHTRRDGSYTYLFID